LDEQILVVTSADVSVYLDAEGFVPSDEKTLEEVVSQGSFCARCDAEGNPLLRQLIPYVVLVKNGDVFTVTRSKGQSEARLHDKLSVGIGGHLNELDVRKGAVRELHEELYVSSQDLSLKFLGFINDLSSPVSRDHLGCLFICQVSGEVGIREKDKMWGQFRSLAYLRDHVTQLEGWSQIALEVLEKGPSLQALGSSVTF